MDNKTFGFTEKELQQLIDFTLWYCEGHNGAYDMRKMRSHNVKNYLLNDLHCGLVEYDGRYYAPMYEQVIHFSPTYHLPMDALWDIFSKHIFKGTGKNNDGKRTQGYSIRKEQGWLCLNIRSESHRQFAEIDETQMWHVLSKLAQYGYIIFQSAGSVWEITEI